MKIPIALISTILLLTGCTQTDPGAVTPEPTNPSPTATSSPEVEDEVDYEFGAPSKKALRELVDYLGLSCNRAITEGVVESNENGDRSVLLAYEENYKSYTAFYELKDGASDLVFSQDWFLVCAIYIETGMYAEESGDSKLSNFPIKVSSNEAGEFLVSYSQGPAREAIYRFGEGVLVEVEMTSAGLISVEYSGASEQDRKKLVKLVQNLGG